MHDPDVGDTTPDEVTPAPVPYVRPEVEQRSSSRDPLVWTVSSPICL